MATIQLVAHASVIVELGGHALLTDPWLGQRAFNDSWELIAPAADLTTMVDRIDHLWISHEHPDHFHIPSLKSLPGDFRRRVTVLFQQSSDAPKMVAALNRLGFADIRLLPNRTWLPVGGCEIYCFQSRQMDSALAMRGGGVTILNLNDCQLSARDLAALRRDVGPVDALLNQFSLGGFDGVERDLPSVAARILDDVVAAHLALDARTTIPFASLARFACADNAFINAHANTPAKVADRFAAEGLSLTILYPGDAWTVGAPHDNAAALAAYERAFAEADARPAVATPSIAIERIEAAFSAMRAKLRRQHGLWLALLAPLTIPVPDLATTVTLDFARGRFGVASEEPVLEIESQPLHFMLSHSFGVQTLGVSGRYRLLGDKRNWMMHRILFAMLNAGIGLSFRQVLSRAQLAFFWRRRGDIAGQLYAHLQTSLARPG